MKNLKIGVRLFFSYALGISMVIGISVIAAVYLEQASHQIQELVSNAYVKTELVHQIKDYANFNARQMRNALLANSADEASHYLQQIAETKVMYDPLAQKLEALAGDGEGRRLFDEMRAALSRYRDVRTKTMDLIKQEKKDEARELMFGEMRKEQKSYFEALDNLVKFQADQMARSGNEAAAATRGATMIIATIAIAATVLAVLFGWMITRSVAEPARAAVASANLVADGDLTERIEVKSKDEMGQLMHALQKMNANLAHIIGGVRASVEAISSAARQIAAGNSDLSQRTEEQAASLEETASSMAQLTQTVRQNADNARQANTLATNAALMAGEGNNAVQGMVETIGKISQSSVAITEITGLIEGIAFQTNILALNAAVEAARAGEHGRGFAVVAGEVRSLAQRASTAAKEIKGLIESSVAMVGDGSKQAAEVGLTMVKVKQAIQQVSDLIGEITAASEEQSRGIEQVNEAVHQMDEMTQQNAALVEQAAASAQSMHEQSNSLARAVSVFKLDGITSVSTTHEHSQELSALASRQAMSAKPKAMRIEYKSNGAQIDSTTAGGSGAVWEKF